MDFLETFDNGSGISEVYKGLIAKKGVEEFALEYKNDRKVRDEQVGNRQDKVTKENTVAVAKITIPLQRKIVKSAASFLLGNPVDLVPSENNDSSGEFIKLWKDMRLDSLLLNFCKKVKSETEAAIIFFPVEKEGQDAKIKARVLSSDNGKIYPIFDAFGDMVAFIWEYLVAEGDKEVKYLYVWTDEEVYIFTGEGSDFKPAETNSKTENPFGKIPVVYASQDQPEWWEVQDLIDRFENSFSKFADTNDYFAHPTYKAKGGITSKIKKDDTGRVVKMDIIETDKGNIIEADLDVISWDRAPEALKLEFETLRSLIFDLSGTADFDRIINAGIGQLTNMGVMMMFFNSVMKSKDDEGDYQIVISRMISIMKSGMEKVLKLGSASELEVLEFDVRFTNILPQNLKEIVDVLLEATGGKAVMSQKTAVAHNPLVANDEEELTTIQEEENASNILDLGDTQL